MFLFGFAKSRKANVAGDDLRDLADFGALLLSMDDDGIEAMLAGGELKEVVFGAQRFPAYSSATSRSTPDWTRSRRTSSNSTAQVSDSWCRSRLPIVAVIR
ncbi:MAG: hypothetical protein F9K44_08970 [Hyphomicrobiaceae bacterium]|nr:MAG: hypothetical protein F9K44_08970 [Hyphomicrobiaceae bacterium]